MRTRCWFKWRGINSGEYGYLESLPLDIRAERTTSIVELPNGGPIVFETDGYKASKITLNLGLSDISNENLDDIAAWLRGEDKLFFSNDPDRYYRAVCNGSYIGKNIINRLGKIPISFDILPFKYQDQDIETIELPIVEQADHNYHLDFSTVDIPESCMDTMPVFKIYGTGELGIFNFAHYTSIKAYDVTDYFILDVQKGAMYDSSGNVILNDTSSNVSKFVCLPDYNNFRVDATVTKVELLANTVRWL